MTSYDKAVGKGAGVRDTGQGMAIGLGGKLVHLAPLRELAVWCGI